jgi:hypothetical protein
VTAETPAPDETAPYSPQAKEPGERRKPGSGRRKIAILPPGFVPSDQAHEQQAVAAWTELFAALLGRDPGPGAEEEASP